jgi:hypothetical protein
MEEIWKDIPGYEGLYQVSNTGKIKSFSKFSPPSGRILKTSVSRGYVWVRLFNKDKKYKNHTIHRLVANAFVPNPNNYKEVNHKDENKQNNNADNLEWCSRAYNMSYGTARFRQGLSGSRSVEQLTMDNISIALYCSVSIASRINNVDSSSILKCCKGEREYVGGYKWRFVDYPLAQ